MAADELQRATEPEAPGPLVSVIVSNYNYARFLGECVESVLTQTYRHLELIVVDDGSTDESLEVARRYAGRDPRVRVIAQENAGQAAGFNAGFKASSGEIVCFMDSDDYWMPQKVERVVGAFEQGGYSLVQHSSCVVDEQGEPTGEVFPPAGVTGDVLRLYLAENHVSFFSPTSGLACRRRDLERIFPLDAQSYLSYYWADVAVSRPMPIFGQVFSFEEPLGYYRRHGGNRSLHGPSRRNEVRAQVLHARYTNEMLERFGVEGRIRFRRSKPYRWLASTLPLYHPDRLWAALLTGMHRLRRAALRVAAFLTPRPIKRWARRRLGWPVREPDGPPTAPSEDRREARP